MPDSILEFWNALYKVEPGIVIAIGMVAVWQVIIKPLFFNSSPSKNSSREAEQIQKPT